MELYAPDLKRMRLYVYRRPLHPELFTIFLDKRIHMKRYEAQLWMTGMGHLISFHSDERTVSELLTVNKELLTEKGLVEDFPVDRSRSYEGCFEDQIYYMLNVQSEQMSEGVFTSFYEEMTTFARKRGMFMIFDQWATPGSPPPFSFIDYEHRPTELDIFTYHAFPCEKVMLRTQSIFSLEPVEHSGRPGPFDSPR